MGALPGASANVGANSLIQGGEGDPHHNPGEPAANAEAPWLHDAKPADPASVGTAEPDPERHCAGMNPGGGEGKPGNPGSTERSLEAWARHLRPGDMY